MKTPLIALCAALAACAVHAQGANQMKPGLWETRMVKMTADGQDMLPMMKAAQEQMRKAMASMPPEQRKQMEASLDAKGDPTVERMCVSAEMAKSDQAMLPKQSEMPGCDQPKIDHSGNSTTFEVSCKVNGGATVTKGESVASGDQITTKAEVVTTMGGAKHTMVSEAQMKFLGSDCGGLKPLDQLVKEARQAGAGARAPAKK